MKKILIVTTRSPFPLFSGDKLRIYNIASYLSQKNKIDLIYTGSEKNVKRKIKFINKTIFIKTNKLKSFFYTLYLLTKGKPMQVGYFFSFEMKKKIEKIQKDYDCIIFHLVRGSEFLPNNYKGRKILEMTDVISKNYSQLYKKLSLLNPLKYLYFLEQILLKKYEKKIIKLFDHVILVSKADQNFFFEKKKLKLFPMVLAQEKKFINLIKKVRILFLLVI